LTFFGTYGPGELNLIKTPGDYIKFNKTEKSVSLLQSAQGRVEIDAWASSGIMGIWQMNLMSRESL
jgi:hypothetical protein